MRYLVEFEVMNPDTQEVSTLTFTSGGQMQPFLPNDPLRPNVWFDPRVKDINGVTAHMFSKGKTQGDSTLGSGVVILTNFDGALDYLLNWGYSGRPIHIYSGDGLRFSDYSLYFYGIIDTIEFSYSKNSSGSLEISVRSKKKIFDKDISTNYYAGTNSGATGNEGLAENSIKDDQKPLCFGKCLNITPVLVNSSAHRYQVHDGPINDVTAVYSNGSSIGKSATFPPSAGQYYIDTATGIFTLGTAPTGSEVITCDVEGATFSDTYYFTAAELVREIAIHYGGLLEADLDLPAFTALATQATQTVGIFVSGVKKPKPNEKTSATIASFLDQLMESIGGYWMFNTSSKLTIGQLAIPTVSDTPVASISKYEIIDMELIKSGDPGSGVPLFNLTMQAVKNWTVQTTLAGVVTEDRKEFLAKEYRNFVESDATNALIYKTEDAKMTITTLLTETAEAAAEAIRRMDLYRSRRFFFRLVVDRGVLPDNVDLNQIIELSYNRFGLESGKKFVILGISFNYPQLNQVELELWG